MSNPLASISTDSEIDALQSSGLYARLHSISKSLEGSGRLDEHDNPDAYATILETMAFIRLRCGAKEVECMAVEFSGGSCDEVQNMSEEIPVVSEVAQTITDEADGDLVLIINGGGVGFNVGGRVIVKPVRDWHRMALEEYSLCRVAIKVDARDATPEQLRHGADVLLSLKEPKT